MEVQRKCQWCGKPFIAHTMVTRFCSKSCTEKAYKDKKRKQKLQEYEAKQNEQPMQEVGIVGGKPFLSPAEAATLFRHQSCHHLSAHGCRYHSGVATSWAHHHTQIRH